MHHLLSFFAKKIPTILPVGQFYYVTKSGKYYVTKSGKYYVTKGT